MLPVSATPTIGQALFPGSQRPETSVLRLIPFGLRDVPRNGGPGHGLLYRQPLPFLIGACARGGRQVGRNVKLLATPGERLWWNPSSQGFAPALSRNG